MKTVRKRLLKANRFAYGSDSAIGAASEATGAVTPATKSARLPACILFLVALALTIGYIVTRSPWWDEGLFADVALNFRNYGHFGSSVLDPNGYLQWPQVHRYTYWQFPMYLVALGAWFHLVPATVRWMRVFSLLWGCVYLVSWFLLVRAWSRNERLAFFITGVLALDYTVISAASDGRMEMMCAALGYAALASYVSFYETRWTAGILLASVFGAASLFCHPMGVIPNLSLAVLLLFDWRQINWRWLWMASLPYLLGAFLCALYILQAPRIFDAQYHAATTYRVRTAFTVIKSIFVDAYQRYWSNFFLLQPGINKIRVIILAFAVIGTCAVALDPALRKQLLGRRLLLLAVIAYLGIAVIDNQGFPFYMVYLLPVMTACGAFWVYAKWHGTSFRRFIPAAFLATSLLIVVAGYSLKISKYDYGRLYRPAVAAAEEHRRQGGIIMGGSELGFLLGFHSSQLIDDRYLGYFSGVVPDVYVQSQYYYRMPGPELTRAWNTSRERLKEDYHLVFQNADYRVYALNQDARTAAVKAARRR